ncbi:MAG: hypothetical protein EOO89_10840 [Pedobacter sp.]|nr:MAG: hypothetical protein EOO89_10840 [Pedobacter sp.]
MSGQSKLFLLILFFLLSGCASITPPSGGPKDEIAPKLISVTPADKSLNYSGQTILLKFDEEVELKDLQKELIITPYTDNTYTTKVSKNTIELKFGKPLNPTTTYTFNFRNSIRDLTESNAAILAPIIFSTGSYLDSGTVAGTVTKHLTNMPEADADVLLYRAQDTGTVKTAKPFYVTRTDALGKYSFTNLATGVYKIYALTDKNNSLTYDQDTERIGFLKDSVVVAAKTAPADIRTTRIDTRKPYVLKRNIKTDRAELEYNEGVTSFRIINQPATDSIIYWRDEKGKTIYIQRRPEEKEVKFIAHSADSAGFQGIDTISIAYNLAYRTKKPVLKLESDPFYVPGKDIKLSGSVPVRTIAENAFYIAPDSLTKLPVSYTLITENGNQQIILKPTGLPTNTLQFELVSDSTALISVTGKPFTQFIRTFTVEEGITTGSVKGKIETQLPNYILQLLTAEFKVEKELRNPKAFHFTGLKPGSYRLRILVDDNNNGKWDNASPDLSSLPEHVYFYPELLEIRANWDLEDIIFNPEKTVDKRLK